MKFPFFYGCGLTVEQLILIDILSICKFHHRLSFSLTESFPLRLPRYERPLSIVAFAFGRRMYFSAIALPGHRAPDAISIGCGRVYCVGGHYFVLVFIVELPPVGEWPFGFGGGAKVNFGRRMFLFLERRHILGGFFMDKLFYFKRYICKFVDFALDKPFFH